MVFQKYWGSTSGFHHLCFPFKTEGINVYFNFLILLDPNYITHSYNFKKKGLKL